MYTVGKRAWSIVHFDGTGMVAPVLSAGAGFELRDQPFLRHADPQTSPSLSLRHPAAGGHPRDRARPGLLVLDLHVPTSELIHSEGALWHAPVGLAPHFVPYLMSFLTLGIFWVGQQTQLGHFARSDRDLAWIQLGFLFSVSLIPFSTGFLSAFLTFRIALIAYWFNLFLLGFWLFVAWRYGARAGLLKEEAIGAVSRSTERRILVAQGLYALGGLLCVVNTYVRIAFIVLVQLNFAIAPRFLRLHRI